MDDEKYLKAIEKLALGYEYEEVQTLIEETDSGQKKKITRTKKHVPPNYQAARFMLYKTKLENKVEQTSGEKFETEEFKKEEF